jgi:hypothetical protein
LLATGALVVRDAVALDRWQVWLLVLLGALVGWTALSAIWAPDPATPLLEAERACVYLGAVAALFLLRGGSPARPVAAGVAAAAFGISVWALWERLFPHSAPASAGLGAYRLAGPVGYWNGLGLLAVLGLLLSLAFAAHAKRPAGRAAAAAALVFLLPTLEFTFSRGSWLALAVGLVALLAFETDRLERLPRYALALPAPLIALLLATRSEALTRPGSSLHDAVREGHRLAVALLALAFVAGGLALLAEKVPAPRVSARSSRRLAATTGIALVLLVVGAVAYEGGPGAVANRAAAALRSEQAGATAGSLNSRLLSASGSGRTDYWRVAWRETEAHPLLGGGAGSFDRWWLQRRPTGYGALDAHNLYLETLAELGPVGLALLVGALALPLARLLRVRRVPLAAACGAAYVAFLAHAALDWDWELTGVGLAGLLCGAAIVGSGEPELRPLRRPHRAAGLAIALSLAAFVFVLHVGNVSLARSGTALDRDETTAAVRAARRAEDWQPWSTRPLVALGEARLAAGDVEGAAATFRRAARRDRGDWQAWYDLALTTHGPERARALAVVTRLNPRAPELAALRP